MQDNNINTDQHIAVLETKFDGLTASLDEQKAVLVLAKTAIESLNNRVIVIECQNKQLSEVAASQDASMTLLNDTQGTLNSTYITLANRLQNVEDTQKEYDMKCSNLENILNTYNRHRDKMVIWVAALMLFITFISNFKDVIEIVNSFGK